MVSNLTTGMKRVISRLRDKISTLAAHFYTYDTARTALDADPTPSPTNRKPHDFNHLYQSTKHHDDKTQLYYYGSRSYNPDLGRWINRDPIGEDGGTNLYSFVMNCSLDLIDVLGQMDFTVVYEYNVPPKEMIKMPDGSRAAGQTKSFAFYHYNVDYCGLFGWGSKIKLTDYDAYALTKIKFRRSIDPNRRAGDNYTIKTHEERHKDIPERWWERIDVQYRAYIDVCMCPECFSAVIDYLRAVESYYRTYESYENTQFDCVQYPGGRGKRGGNKRKACRKARKLQGEVIKKYRKDVVPTMQERDRKCG